MASSSSSSNYAPPTSRFTYARSGYQALGATVPETNQFSTNYELPSSLVQLIPVFKSFGYNSLSHGYSQAPVSTSNFFQYRTAYPMDNCGEINIRRCDAQSLYSFNTEDTTPAVPSPSPSPS